VLDLGSRGDHRRKLPDVGRGDLGHRDDRRRQLTDVGRGDSATATIIGASSPTCARPRPSRRAPASARDTSATATTTGASSPTSAAAPVRSA